MLNFYCVITNIENPQGFEPFTLVSNAMHEGDRSKINLNTMYHQISVALN